MRSRVRWRKRQLPKSGRLYSYCYAFLMSRAKAAGHSAEEFLERARLARTAPTRAKYATRGLAHPRVDKSTRAMLLRQLYLAHMENEHFDEARVIGEQMVELGAMPDVARQDAARACLGLEDIESAIQHLRIASRVAPASRRAFHWWTLGSTLYLLDRYDEAIGALSRAARWGTTAKPLYLAQLALAQRAAGQPHEDLRRLREDLEDAPCGQGYGQFVLGELSYQQGDHRAANEYLSGFVKRAEAGRIALAVALSSEIARAQALLRSLEAFTTAS